MVDSRCRTVTLEEVTLNNFNDCAALERKSSRFVGNAESVLALAYVYRENSLAYAICSDETIIGLVILRVNPQESRPYSFTEMFIADGFQRQGYGKQAVKAILEKFRKEKKSELVQIQVHDSNEVAIKIYEQCGFVEISRAKWNNEFLVMELQL